MAAEESIDEVGFPCVSIPTPTSIPWLLVIASVPKTLADANGKPCFESFQSLR